MENMYILSRSATCKAEWYHRNFM